MRLTNRFKAHLVCELVDKKYPTTIIDKLKDEACIYYNKLVNEYIPSGWKKYSQFMETAHYVKVLSESVKIKNEYPNFDGDKSIHFVTATGNENWNTKRIIINDLQVEPVKKIIKWRKDKDEFRDSISGVIMQYTTKKKLLHDIPEMIEFFDTIDEACTALVPIETINKIKSVFNTP